MYPFLRLGWQLWRHRNDPKIDITDEHVSHHVCWPWDVDGFIELNNGRTLTLFDLGRFTAGGRMGLSPALRRRGWGLAVAGVSIRYRRRVTPFDRIRMTTRCAGWDGRFFYILQAMYVRGECTSQALLRTAVTSRGGSVPTDEVLNEMGRSEAPPDMPRWVNAWIEAEGTRPWPPERVPEGHVPPAF